MLFRYEVRVSSRGFGAVNMKSEQELHRRFMSLGGAQTYVDRIVMRNGKLRIYDRKTGERVR